MPQGTLGHDVEGGALTCGAWRRQERGLTGRQELVSHQLDQAIVPNELNGWVKLVEGNIQT